ncbi:DNA-processing protein DprA [Massilia yuzhufengensis]|uniref:DNA protecting protein DprA n=1 Tax=Massilia yuzhufengensis TaxID=1164594 RepID=A0A1I1KNM3_9BURK|nr:DNA-processing protein DprA [Massilia yuzhufengensis]SFC62524.1 DNA protecting protein DprA [Massilia yuzhufengensis]
MHDTAPQPASSRDEHALIADWIRLEGVAGVGCRTAHLLLDVFGSPAAIFRAGRAALAAHVPAAQAAALCAPMSLDTARIVEATLAWLRDPAHAIVTLHDLDYPEALRHIADPPLLLYINGRRALLSAPMIAVVGSRNASSQGKANAEGFAEALSRAGLCVVSGMALGIDTAAHEGALRGEGSTIAVIGTGPDRVYPARNRALAHRIAEQGCIVSEYALGTPPVASNFPRRNRIISGMTAGVLVVEAAAQSGSLITAQMAAEQGREVFALPGSIHSALAKGCHQLIREGARLVETVDEVLEAMRVSPLVRQAAPPPACNDALLAALGHDPVGPDELLARIGGDAAALAGELLALELAGVVERLPGGALQRVVRAT